MLGVYPGVEQLQEAFDGGNAEVMAALRANFLVFLNRFTPDDLAARLAFLP